MTLSFLTFHEIPAISSIFRSFPCSTNVLPLAGGTKPTPPPILPPKTRKPPPGVVGGSSPAVASSSEQELSTTAGVTAAESSLGSLGSPAQSAHADLRTTESTSQPTKRLLGATASKSSSNLLETFVDDGVSIVRIGPTGTSLGRSASSVSGVGAGARKERIAKPVRRSKSQLPGSK